MFIIARALRCFVTDITPRYRFVASTQTLLLHRRHRSPTQTLQPYRHFALPTDTVLAMIGGQVGLFPEDREQAPRFNRIRASAGNESRLIFYLLSFT
jgi:hypothetical protein